MSMETSLPREVLEMNRPADSLLAGLQISLSNSFVLMMKTQACHWNVTGPLFAAVHEMTQVQYEDLFVAVDDLAERIRALGQPAPCSLAELIRNATIEEQTGPQPAESMVSDLARDHRVVAAQMQDIVRIAETACDSVTADMLTARIAVHDKTAWMLEALVTR